MLEKNPANMIAMKRLVCVHKARGKVTEAIAELTKILETFQNDPECWKELVNLYMSLGDMKQAVYCQEEVVMCDPRNYQVHPMPTSVLAWRPDQHSIGASAVCAVAQTRETCGIDHRVLCAGRNGGRRPTAGKAKGAPPQLAA